MPDDDLDALKQEMETLQHQMTDAERELLAGLEKFIEIKVGQGMSKEAAYDLVAAMFRKAREIRARMTERGWGRPFEDPIDLGRRKLVRLRICAFRFISWMNGATPSSPLTCIAKTWRRPRNVPNNSSTSILLNCGMARSALRGSRHRMTTRARGFGPALF